MQAGRKWSAEALERLAAVAQGLCQHAPDASAHPAVEVGGSGALLDLLCPPLLGVLCAWADVRTRQGLVRGCAPMA